MDFGARDITYLDSFPGGCVLRENVEDEGRVCVRGGGDINILSNFVRAQYLVKSFSSEIKCLNKERFHQKYRRIFCFRI